MRFPSSLISAGAAALLIAGLPAIAAADPPGSPDPGNVTPGAESVSLITGDTVRRQADGEFGFIPGPGRENAQHVTYFKNVGGRRDQFVIPSDAVRPIREGVLDERLFDITALVADGYAGRELPVIVRDAPGSFAAASASEDVWDKVTGDRVENVWLDGVARFTLAESVPQIGAPVAWQSGYTGTGVTVAVIDDGYDPTHPDLAGRVTAAKDFTGTSPGAIDGYGHGTHVASTVAGSGAASNGKYKGVAPGANLLIGKVCTDDGRCPESDIIAGLEWAAENGADVANVSLGTYPTDGTDPLSVAVNEITERTGMLIVVASGNFGCRECVSAPASADKALAVGSVTKQDAFSEFSSMGPRYGDGALKPDLAAPGSGIVAARAKGTAMGSPVDDNYTSSDGTSMASPHVAGAAALLKQAHPDWTADRLKAAMMGASKGLEGLDVYQAGAGRVDIGAAVSATVSAGAGSVSFGRFEGPYTRNPDARQVAYTNDGDTDVVLNLAVAGESMFAVDRATVTVPAHGTASVAVSAAIVGGALGAHGAVLTATADGVSVRTALGVVLAPEMYDLTIDIKTRNGGPVMSDGLLGSNGIIFGLDSGWAEFVTYDENGRVKVRVPVGRYQIAASIEEGGSSPSMTSFAENISVTADTTRVADLAAGELVDVKVDAADAVLFETMDIFQGNDASGGKRYSFNKFGKNGMPDYWVPNADTSFGTQIVHATTYSDPGASYSYTTFLEKRSVGVPGRTTFTVHDNELAREDSVFHSQGVDTVGRRTHWSYTYGFWSIDAPDTPLPGRRTEYFTPGDWTGMVTLGDSNDAFEFITHDSIRAAGTSTTVVWGQAPLGVGPGQNGRYEDTVTFVPAMFDDANPKTWFSDGKSGASTGTAKLTVDGKEVALSQMGRCVSGTRLPQGTSGTFEFSCDVTRSTPFSTIGTASSATWRFHSEPSGKGGELAMLGVRVSSPSVVNGYAPVSKIQKVDLDVFRPGATGDLGTTKLTFEVSYDEGKTWKSVPVLRTGDHATTALLHPKGATSVSTRITAIDADGNSVTQKTIRSYGLS